MKYADDYLKLIKTNPVKIAYELGYTDLTDLHNEWIKKFIFAKEDYLLQAHRGSYKTTCLKVALPIIMTLLPDDNILMMRKAEPDVVEIIKGVEVALRHPLFVDMAYVFWGKLLTIRATQTQIDTNLVTFDRGTPQLVGLGVNGSLTGKHFERVYTDDICFIAGTKVATKKGDINIENIKTGDYVLTPIGFKKVVRTSHRAAEVITKNGLTGTKNHPIYNKDKNMFDNLCDSCYNHLSKLTLGDLIKWKIAETLYDGTAESGKEQVESIISYGHIIKRGLVKCYTERYGKNTTAKFLMGMLFTIKTIIPTITALKTWSVYRLRNIKECMQKSVANGVEKTLKRTRDPHLHCGKNQKKGRKFLKRLAKILQKGIKRKFMLPFVKNADKNIGQSLEEHAVCAENAKRKETQELATKNITFAKSIKKLYVVFAEKLLFKSTKSKNTVQKNVIQRQDVFNIEVEDINVYYANKVLVHNCNMKDRASEAERKHTKLVYQELQNLKNRGGIIGNTGTPWHKEDAFMLMPKPEVYTCYDTGLISKEELKKIKASMTPSLFAANYELKHIADENALFTNPQYTDEESLIYDGMCHIDAGYGGEDYTAFTIMKKTDSGFIAFGKMWSKHVDDCLEEIFLLREKYRAGTICVEHNGDKGYLSKELYKKAEEYYERGLIQSKYVDVNGYHEAMNKDVKIKTYLYTHWNSIKWLENTDYEYMNQILDYTDDAAHDDSPDSAASLLRRLINGGKVTAIKSLWD